MINEFAEYAIKKLQEAGFDWAEIYYEENYYSNLKLDDFQLKTYQRGVEKGIGIRIIHNNHEKYISTNILTADNVTTLIKRVKSEFMQKDHISENFLARAFCKGNQGNFTYDFPIQKVKQINDRILPELQDKIGFSSINSEYNDSYQNIEVYNTNGESQKDTRHDQSLTILGIKKIGERTFTYNEAIDMTKDYSMDYNHLKQLTELIKRDACNFANAKPFIGANSPVVIAKGQGVLIHEIVGHVLEADNVLNNASVFAEKRGTRIANKHVSIMDENIPGQKGYYRVDDEGVEKKKTILVHEGILETFLTDRMTARQLHLPLTGNGRRESYLYPPLPRMSCTYLDRGSIDPEDLIAEIQDGYYVQKLLGGEVNGATGEFFVNAPQIYRITNGRICEPLYGAILSGNILNVMNNILGVGNDLEMNCIGKGLCYKTQSVPVSFGLPTILIGEIDVKGGKA